MSSGSHTKHPSILIRHPSISPTIRPQLLQHRTTALDPRHRRSPNTNIIPQPALCYILHRLEKRPWTRKCVRFRIVGDLEIGRVGGFRHGGVVERYAFEVVFQKGPVVLEDAEAEVLQAGLVGATGEEGLGGGFVGGVGDAEAGQGAEGGNGGAVVGVDAWVGLEELHAEEIGCCSVVSAVSFKERPL